MFLYYQTNYSYQRGVVSNLKNLCEPYLFPTIENDDDYNYSNNNNNNNNNTTSLSIESVTNLLTISRVYNAKALEYYMHLKRKKAYRRMNKFFMFTSLVRQYHYSFVKEHYKRYSKLTIKKSRINRVRKDVFQTLTIVMIVMVATLIIFSIFIFLS